MPINIIDYSNTKHGDKGNTIEHLCENEWELPVQINALESWLIQNKNNISKGSYVVDIGFSPRLGAAGGGAVLNAQAMEVMVSIGMNLYLSEYPAFDDE